MALWYDVMGRPSFLAPFLWETLFFEQELQVLGHFEVAVLPGGGIGPLFWGSSVRSQVRTSAVAPAGQAGWHRPTSVRWGRSWLLQGEGEMDRPPPPQAFL